MKKSSRVLVSTLLFSAFLFPSVALAPNAMAILDIQKLASDAKVKTDIAAVQAAINIGIGTGMLESSSKNNFDGKSRVTGLLITQAGQTMVPSSLRVYIISDNGNYRSCVSGKSLSGKTWVWKSSSSSGSVVVGKACTKVK